MAVTKIIPIRTRLSKALDYIKDEHKTNDMMFVSGLECSPNIAFEQYNMTKQYYNKSTRNLAYHVIQSFKPGEIDKEDAHKIGIEFARKITGGNYEAVVATHINQDNIHTHIIFNSVSFVDGKKFNNFKNSYKFIRAQSDQICQKYNLSIIDAKNKGTSYKEWYSNKNGTSWKTMIKDDINTAIKRSGNYNEFLNNMKNLKYEIGEGKHIKFRKAGYSRFVRGKTLGMDYTKDSIMARIDLNKIGFAFITIGSIQKKYIKKKYFGPQKSYRPKNYLSFNINLGIKLLKLVLLNQDKQNIKRPNYLKKYDTAIIDKLSEQIKYINKNNITSRRILVDIIEQNEDHLYDTRDLLKVDEIKNKNLKEIIKTINIYQSSKQNIVRIFNKFDPTNPKAVKKLNTKYKNNPDVNAFLAAKAKLADMEITNEYDMEFKSAEYNEYTKRQDTLKSRYQELKKEAFALSELYNTVCKIQNREYPFNYGIKREREAICREIDRSMER